MRKQIDCDPTIEGTILCPVFSGTGQCFTDRHHLQFPRKDVRSRAEKSQRSDHDYQLNVCRALHNAIHASNYAPEIPNSLTGEEEAAMQLSAGQLALEGYMEKRNV